MSRLWIVVTGLLGVAVVVEGALLVDARGRLDALEAHPPVTGPASAPRAARWEREQFRGGSDDVDGAAPRAPAPMKARPSAAGDDSVSGDRALQQQVQQQVQQELARVDDEREARREDRQRARLSERIADLAAAAGLNDKQVLTMTSILQAESVEIRQIMKDARDSGDMDDVRTKIREVRAKTDENVGSLLDAKQLAAYKDQRAADVARFGGGRLRDAADAGTPSDR